MDRGSIYLEARLFRSETPALSIQSKALRPLFPVATDRNAGSIRRERG